MCRCFCFSSTAIWAVAEILFGPRRSSGALAALWLAAGLAFGLAGLAKYAAVFAPMGLFGFLVFSRRHRHWLWHPYPYLGAALAFAVFSPALIWNYQHHWVSFGFQSRADGVPPGLEREPRSQHAARGLGAPDRAAFALVGVPLVLALWTAARSRDPESPSRFLLWLTGVPLLLFSAMPFLGERAIPHWYNSAWLFAFPLLGDWLSQKSAGWLRSWAIASAGLPR